MWETKSKLYSQAEPGTKNRQKGDEKQSNNKAIHQSAKKKDQVQIKTKVQIKMQKSKTYQKGDEAQGEHQIGT